MGQRSPAVYQERLWDGEWTILQGRVHFKPRVEVAVAVFEEPFAADLHNQPFTNSKLRSPASLRLWNPQKLHRCWSNRTRSANHARVMLRHTCLHPPQICSASAAWQDPLESEPRLKWVVACLHHEQSGFAPAVSGSTMGNSISQSA